MKILTRCDDIDCLYLGLRVGTHRHVSYDTDIPTLLSDDELINRCLTDNYSEPKEQVS